MCDCPNPDVLTEWTGHVGIEHHMCCGTTESVARDAKGNVINLTAVQALYDQQETAPRAMTEIRRPTLADLYQGPYSRHIRPSRADDQLIQHLVKAIFDPSPPWQPEDPELVQQLLDRAPQADQLGVDDWDRPLRADEIADIYGTPMEGPDTRFGWLRRADEIARAWGRPLFGPEGVRPDIALPD